MEFLQEEKKISTFIQYIYMEWNGMPPNGLLFIGVITPLL